MSQAVAITSVGRGWSFGAAFCDPVGWTSGGYECQGCLGPSWRLRGVARKPLPWAIFVFAFWVADSNTKKSEIEIGIKIRLSTLAPLGLILISISIPIGLDLWRFARREQHLVWNPNPFCLILI
jgi:hypothetical protein